MTKSSYYGDQYVLEQEKKLFFKDHETFIKEAEDEKDLQDLFESSKEITSYEPMHLLRS